MTTATIRLHTTEPVRAQLGGTGHDLPILHFRAFLDGVFDIHPSGTPAEIAAWLRHLAEQASSLAIMVERRAQAAQDAAFATYPEAVA